MPTRDKQYLLDILQAARIALEYVADQSKADFENNLQCQDAVIRRLEIIGEASRRVSESTRENHPDLPWKDMMQMRNFLAHEYDGVDLNIVWDTLKNDLPSLIDALEKIIR